MLCCACACVCRDPSCDQQLELRIAKTFGRVPSPTSGLVLPEYNNRYKNKRIRWNEYIHYLFLMHPRIEASMQPCSHRIKTHPSTVHYSPEVHRKRSRIAQDTNSPEKFHSQKENKSLEFGVKVLELTEICDRMRSSADGQTSLELGHVGDIGHGLGYCRAIGSRDTSHGGPDVVVIARLEA